MAPFIIKSPKFRYRSKIAAFDYDWTLIKPKSQAKIPKSVDDWQWLDEKIPQILKNFYNKGFCIVVFTNQTKQWKIDQIKNVMNVLEIPFIVYIGMDKGDQKPNTIMFDHFTKDKKWDKKQSFFVGDALGRKCDWSNMDKIFANSIGIQVKSPEEIFNIDYFGDNQKTPQSELNNVKLSSLDNQEVIITTGYPGSGKSTLMKNIFGSIDRYVILHGDDLKTSKKMIKAAIPHLNNGKSIIFDATNPSKEKRSEYITFIKQEFPTIKIRCVHISTSIEESMKRNKQRPEKEIVPNVVFYIYRKKFQQPSEDEGCDVITI